MAGGHTVLRPKDDNSFVNTTTLKLVWIIHKVILVWIIHNKILVWIIRYLLLLLLLYELYG